MTLVAQAVPAVAAEQPAAQGQGPQDQQQAQQGERASAIALPDVLGTGEITADTVTAIRNSLSAISEGRSPRNMTAMYNASRGVINTMAVQGAANKLGIENVGSELTLSLDVKGEAPPGGVGEASVGEKVRIVTDVGTNLADGKNQITVGLIGIDSMSVATGDISGKAKGKGKGALDVEGPGTANERHAGVVFAYVTPHDQPLPDQFPDINDPSTMMVGSTLRMMPVDADWSTWNTSKPGYYEDSVDVRFGEMVQVTRTAENEVQIATGPVNIHVDEPGVHASLFGNRLAVTPSSVEGDAKLNAQTYAFTDEASRASYAQQLATGEPEAGREPTTIDAKFGQFNINGYLSFAPLSTRIPSKPDTPGVPDPGQFAINVGADLTIIGQLPYSGYVVAEVHPPENPTSPPTVTFSRFAPGVEITGSGVLVQDLEGNQYVKDTTVQMNVRDLSYMPHGGVIKINQEQLAALNEATDPKNPDPVDLRAIFPGALPDTYPNTAGFALALGIEALLDLGVTDDRFLVPGNVDYRTQPPHVNPITDLPVPNPERLATPPVPEPNPERLATPPVPEPNPERLATPPVPEPNPERLATPPDAPDAPGAPDVPGVPDVPGLPGSDVPGLPEEPEDAAARADAEQQAAIEALAPPGTVVEFPDLSAPAAEGEPGAEDLGAPVVDDPASQPGISENAAASAAAAAIGENADFSEAFDPTADPGAAAPDSAPPDDGGLGAPGLGDAEPATDAGDQTPADANAGTSESDISDAAAAAGASVDFDPQFVPGVDNGGSSASDLGEASDPGDPAGQPGISENAAASAAAAAIGENADFSGAFGDGSGAGEADAGGGETGGGGTNDSDTEGGGAPVPDGGGETDADAVGAGDDAGGTGAGSPDAGADDTGGSDGSDAGGAADDSGASGTTEAGITDAAADAGASVDFSSGVDSDADSGSDAVATGVDSGVGSDIGDTSSASAAAASVGSDADFSSAFGGDSGGGDGGVGGDSGVGGDGGGVGGDSGGGDSGVGGDGGDSGVGGDGSVGGTFSSGL